ncbi:TIGR03086 family metal-binding protein [Actinoallomurus iriomotensis]|nr:TIGR03086 family metal-binding protein [Actinoallomurus iriomotensis]
MDIRELNRRALAYAGHVIEGAGEARPTLPTPCADWTLHGLLRHVVSQNEGFAAAARGRGAALSVWRDGRLGADPYGAFAASAKLVTEAFGEEGVLDRPFDLPEVRDGVTIPGAVAIGFHFLDTLVHAWDVAATVGAAWEPDGELVTAALAVAAQVPGDTESRGPGLAFEPIVPVADGAPDGDRLLALLGRSPGWTPPGAEIR